MNEKQRKILIGVGSIILIMLIYPPYHMLFNGNVRDAGYAFLLDLPSRATVDVITLLTQWLGVIAVGAILFFLFKDNRQT